MRAALFTVLALTGCRDWDYLGRNHEKNYVFVTSSTYVPSTLASHGMPPLDFADSECNRLAKAAKTPLPGRFKAWLSTSTTGAKSRLTTPEGVAARGWIRPDGRPFIDSLDALSGEGQVFYPARLDENGTDLVPGHEFLVAATGTRADGTAAAYTAHDWTSSSDDFEWGVVGAVDKEWTDGNHYAVNDLHLYCFGTDSVQPISIQKVSGRTAFLSTTPFSPAIGIAGADDACASDATTYGFSGTFQALLSTSTVAAADRFDLNKATWVRVDGVAWLEQASDLKQPSLLSALNLTASGSFAVNEIVWTGSPSPLQKSTPAASQSCSDWSSAASTGIVGRADLPFQAFEHDDSAYVDSRYYSCSNKASVYCLEQ